MKKLFGILSILFILLTFIGAIYVLINKGTVNAGYAVVPMVLTLACSSIFFVRLGCYFILKNLLYDIIMVYML